MASSTPSYIPPGWTAEKLAKATQADYETLSDEVQTKLSQSRADDFQKLLASMNTTTGAAAPVTKPQPRFIQVLENNPPFKKKWGFMAFRSYYTGSDEEWSRFETEFVRLLDEQLAEFDGDVGVTGEIREAFHVSFVEDEGLDGAGVDEIPTIDSHFWTLQQTSAIPPGLDIRICLLVDAEAMASVIAAAASTSTPTSQQPQNTTTSTTTNTSATTSTTTNPGTPWIWAVDTQFYADNPQNPRGYPGKFKVAVDSLAESLWPVVAAGTLEPVELWQQLEADDEDQDGEKIWDDIA